MDPMHVLQFLPGRGETVGATLVRDPRTAIIAFTGSKAVGPDIIRGPDAEGQMHEEGRARWAARTRSSSIRPPISTKLSSVCVSPRSGFRVRNARPARCIIVDAEGPSGPHITRFTGAAR